MRSLTKSVISLLAGAAIDRRLLSADEPVLARLDYPAYKNPDPRKAQVDSDLPTRQPGGLRMQRPRQRFARQRGYVVRDCGSGKGVR
jgi:hypothetical protein